MTTWVGSVTIARCYRVVVVLRDSCRLRDVVDDIPFFHHGTIAMYGSSWHLMLHPVTSYSGLPCVFCWLPIQGVVDLVPDSMPKWMMHTFWHTFLCVIIRTSRRVRAWLAHPHVYSVWGGMIPRIIDPHGRAKLSDPLPTGVERGESLRRDCPALRPLTVGYWRLGDTELWSTAVCLPDPWCMVFGGQRPSKTEPQVGVVCPPDP